MAVRRIARAALLVGLALCFAGTTTGYAQADEAIVLVVHRDNPIEDATVRSLRLVFSGYRRVWHDGRPIHLVIPGSGTPAMRYLVERVFRRKNEDDVHRYYLRAVFQERLASAPDQLDDRRAIARVAVNPGAVALVAESSVVADPRLRVIPLAHATP